MTRVLRLAAFFDLREIRFELVDLGLGLREARELGALAVLGGLPTGRDGALLALLQFAREAGQRQGWSIPEVSKRLGHASPKITAEVYAHALPDRSRPLDFLDEMGNEMGNAWATQHPQTPANPSPVESAKRAS